MLPSRGVLLAGLALIVSALGDPSTSSISLTDFTASISGTADGSTLVSSKGSHPSRLLSSPQFASQHTLEVSGTISSNGKAFKPQQAMLTLTHTGTSLTAVSLGKGKKDGSYSFSITADYMEKQIGKQAGEYVVSLLAGDPSISQGVQWVLGTVELVLSSESTDAPVRTVKTQTLTNQKPVIEHIFRTAEKRPPSLISLVFTALSVMPFLAVLGYCSSLANFNAWPKEGSVATFALAFHGILAAILGLYLYFWLNWDLANTLPAAIAMGLPLAYTGHKVLSGLATARLNSKKD